MYVFRVLDSVSFLTSKFALKGSSSNVCVPSLVAWLCSPLDSCREEVPRRPRKACTFVTHRRFYRPSHPLCRLCINVEVVLQRASPSKSEWPTSQSSEAEESMVLPNSIQTWYRKTSSRTLSSSTGKASLGTSQTEVRAHCMLYKLFRGPIESSLVTPRRWLDQVHFHLFNMTPLR